MQSIAKFLEMIHFARDHSFGPWQGRSGAQLLFYLLSTACLHGLKWLKGEIPVAVLTSMLGPTDGYLTSVLMILALKTVPVSEADNAIVLVVFLGISLVSGSVLGTSKDEKIKTEFSITTKLTHFIST
ncbi:hypothetical protein V6N12_026036 [Hibiscus sabdariffa]|uniref:Cation/H+ exchanger domain-containing protein n=1 Tax=Hibiscus sabdariffa TaxID=183260 RepID=A0ABR2DQL5_9ROSI